MKKKLKHLDDDDNDDEFTYFQDKVEFGEVVDEPPSLDTSKLTKKVGQFIKVNLVSVSLYYLDFNFFMCSLFHCCHSFYSNDNYYCGKW